ncbi:MAG: hypothetical protein ABI780_08755, partial [Ardenticatenales bacterium]
GGGPTISAADARAAACAAAWRKYPALRDVQPTARMEGDARVFTFKAPRGAAPVSLIVRVTIEADGTVRRIVAGR